MCEWLFALTVTKLALSGIMDLVVRVMDLLWMSECSDVFNMTGVKQGATLHESR